MTELELKFDPVTLKVSGGLPGATLCGEMLIAVGIELLTVNDLAVDGIPPGFVTMTSGVPGVAMALAGIDAISVCVGF
jgi:hypothetical protein